MAMQQRDPFSWADDFARQSKAQGQSDKRAGDNKLLAVFQEETRRQQPYFEAPLRMKLQENAANLSLRNQMIMGQTRADMKMKANVAPQKIVQTIEKASQAYGVDPDKLLTLADLESGFNPNAQNPSSSAGGLFQFIDDTAAQYGLANKFDPGASSMAAAALTRDNDQKLEAALGHPPTAGETYLAHQQGVAGAIKLLSNPNAPAENIVGAAAVRQNGGRLGMSAGQFANLWMSKADALYKQRAAARAARRSSGSKPMTLADLEGIELQPLVKPDDDVDLNAEVVIPDDIDTDY